MPLVLEQRSAARLVLATATVGAGLIHLAVAPSHVEGYLPLGVGFFAVGVFQVLWGLLVAVRDSPRWLLVGGMLSLLFVGVYLIGGTVGLPVGPAAYQAEAFATSGLLCCALEVPVGIVAIVLGRRPGALGGRLGARWAVGFAAGLVLAGSASATALVTSNDHGHERSHIHEHGTACPSAPVRTGVADERGVDTGVTAYFRCLLEHQHDASEHA